MVLWSSFSDIIRLSGKEIDHHVTSIKPEVQSVFDMSAYKVNTAA